MVLRELCLLLVTGDRKGTFPTSPCQEWGQNCPRGPLGAQGGVQPPSPLVPRSAGADPLQPRGTAAGAGGAGPPGLPEEE